MLQYHSPRKAPAFTCRRGVRGQEGEAGGAEARQRLRQAQALVLLQPHQAPHCRPHSAPAARVSEQLLRSTCSTLMSGSTQIGLFIKSADLAAYTALAGCDETDSHVAF